MFNPNKKFKKDYDRLFKANPEGANVFLLLCELANKNSEVEIDDNELTILFNARFNHPEEYSL